MGKTNSKIKRNNYFQYILEIVISFSILVFVISLLYAESYTIQEMIGRIEFTSWFATVPVKYFIDNLPSSIFIIIIFMLALYAVQYIGNILLRVISLMGVSFCWIMYGAFIIGPA
jgi:hypothetical protein